MKQEAGLTRGFGSLSKWLAYGSGASLLAMMALVNANVILRPLGLPIWGAYELVGFLGSLTLSLALLKITLTGSHMAVELITSRLSKGANRWLALFNRLLGGGILGLVSWRSFHHGWLIWSTGEVSQTLSMPFHPFIFGVALAFGLSALAMLLDLRIEPEREGE